MESSQRLKNSVLSRYFTEIRDYPLLTKEEEQQLLKEVLRVPVDVGSINCGIPYVATGLIGNSSNVVAGFMSTGPEMFIIGQTLDVVK